jgi:hypothetical protein
MRATIDELSPDRVKTKTYLQRRHALSIIKRGQEMDADERRTRRVAEMECIFCFYGGPRIAGQAFTHRLCGICKIEMQFASTDTDVVCGDCAKIHDLCRHCGSDRELREHRTDYSTFDPVIPPMIEQPQAATVFLLPARKSSKSKGESR